MKTAAMTAEERVRYMTQAPVRRLILEMSAPTVISMLVTSFYNMADGVAIVGGGRRAAGIVFDPGRLYPAKSFRAIPHNSKCRYGERGAADAKPKAQITLDAAKVSAASGGNSEPKQGQRSQSARGFCPRSTMRVPQPDIIEHFGNVDAVPQLPERCLSRQAGIVRCCLRTFYGHCCPFFEKKEAETLSNIGINGGKKLRNNEIWATSTAKCDVS